MTRARRISALMKLLRSTRDTLELAIEGAEGIDAEERPRGGMVIPAYFRNDSLWDQLFAAASEVDIIAIVSRAAKGGPGPDPSTFYVPLIARGAKVPGVVMVGYVSTDYGRRSIAAVANDVDLWYRNYPGIGGVFFDEQASGADHLSYYRTAGADVHARGGIVVSNAGTGCDGAYADYADVLILWENFASAGFPTLEPWARVANDTAIAGLVHACPDADMEEVVEAMAVAGYGWRYVKSTPDGRWGDLGTAFPKLVSLVAGK